MVRETEYPLDELCKHPTRLAHLNSSIMNLVITAAHLMPSVYSDGHSYCFSCHTYTHGDSSFFTLIFLLPREHVTR